jgi:hypothetical protein
LKGDQDFLEEGSQLSSRNAKSCSRKTLSSPQGMPRDPREVLSSPWGMPKVLRKKLKALFKQLLAFVEEN